MSLINQINGELLTRLSPKSSSSASKSQLGGKGLGLSSDGAGVDLTQGLSLLKSAFTDSYLRLNSVVSTVIVAGNQLERLGGIAEQLYSYSSKAAGLETTVEERTRLNSQVKILVTDFEDILNESARGSADILNLADLTQVLKGSGISSSAPTELAQALGEIGGKDGELGYERIELSSELTVDPLSQRLNDRASSERAAEAFLGLKKAVEQDLSGVDSILTELNGALQFARQGALATEDLLAAPLDSSQAETVANRLVQQIKNRTSDPMIAAHSALDTLLVQSVLG